MFSELIRLAKLAIGPPRACKTSENVDIRGRFEFLEPRAMLSASYGHATYEHTAMSRPPMGDGPHFGDAGMFAPESYRRAFDDDGMHDGYRFDGYYRPEMRREARHFDSYRFAPMTWSPPPLVLRPIQPKPGASSVSTPIVIPTSPPVFAEDRRPSSSGNTNQPAKATAPSSPLPNVFGPPLAAAGTGSGILEAVTMNSPSVINTLGNISAIDGVALASSLQATGNDTSINISALPLTIRDAAFARLIIVATEQSRLEPASAIAADQAILLVAESTDEFIRSDEATAAAGSAASAGDTLEQDRAALDEVLRGLHNVAADGTIERTTNSSDGQPTGINDAPGNARAMALDAALDSGMVLLEATGDANESDYDLLAVASADIEFIDAQLRMEASVGLHQALDVATDVLLSAAQAESPPPAETTPADEPRANTVEGTKQQLVHRATATAGITALFGIFAGNRESQRRRRSAEAYQARFRPVTRVLRPGE